MKLTFLLLLNTLSKSSDVPSLEVVENEEDVPWLVWLLSEYWLVRLKENSFAPGTKRMLWTSSACLSAWFSPFAFNWRVGPLTDMYACLLDADAEAVLLKSFLSFFNFSGPADNLREIFTELPTCSKLVICLRVFWGVWKDEKLFFFTLLLLSSLLVDLLLLLSCVSLGEMAILENLSPTWGMTAELYQSCNVVWEGAACLWLFWETTSFLVKTVYMSLSPWHCFASKWLDSGALFDR